MRRRAALLVLAVASAPNLARAHGGNPAQAVVMTPDHIGAPVADSYLVKWLDAGPPPPLTGSAKVNLFYTDSIPQTFPLGIIPPTLTGTAILSNVNEEEGPDEFLWDVTNVPSGHYWIWSRVDDPPQEMSAQYIRFSPAPLTVLHPGDEIGPAITMLKPQSEFSTSDQFYTVDYETYDSTATARIRFEASPDAFRMEPQWFVVADNVYAQPHGTIGFNTSGLDEGDYMLRATITDCEGRSFVAYSRYFLFVAHLEPPDGGPFEAGLESDGGSLEEWCSALPEDTGVVPEMDAGASTDRGMINSDSGGMIEPPDEEGCNCTSVNRDGSIAAFALLLIVLLKRTRRAPPR